jgi:hypothetical protein
MVANDERTRALLTRTEALTEDQLQRLHGVMRSPRPAQPTAGVPAPAAPAALCVGAQVRLHPKRGGDIFDLALAGHTGVVEAIETDFDNRVHVAVTVDADPGQDLGHERLPGHRFFFAPDEVECLCAAEARS